MVDRKLFISQFSILRSDLPHNLADKNEASNSKKIRKPEKQQVRIEQICWKKHEK